MSAGPVDTALTDMMDAVFAEHARDGRGRDDLWQRLDGLGLVRLTGSEGSGGSGAGWAEAAELITAAVRHAARIPLAEHDLLACWLLETAGLPCDSHPRTVAVLDAAGTARQVPWASDAARVVAVWPDGDGHAVADVDPDRLTITPGANAIGEPRDDIAVDLATLQGVSVAGGVVEELLRKAALIRSLQVCAALDRALELSITHVTAREQFGRPLAKFQAVQHLLADLASEAALARAATEAALAAALASGWCHPRVDFLVAAARSCSGHAATVVVRNAHQVHGAIGTTVEHDLHLVTRAALVWRSEFGSMRHWDDHLTGLVLAAGVAGPWTVVCP